MRCWTAACPFLLKGEMCIRDRINQEKERILLHLEAIKADCNALAMDVQRTLKLKDVAEEADLSSFLAHDDEETEEE